MTRMGIEMKKIGEYLVEKKKDDTFRGGEFGGGGKGRQKQRCGEWYEPLH